MHLLISSSIDLGKNYENAFGTFGFSCKTEYCPTDTGYDGLLLSGGGDVSPDLYGKENAGSYGIDNERDKAEMYLFDSYYKQGKPIIGICRGIQMINVALGGTLIQHLKNAEHHLPKDGNDNFHKSCNVKGSVLFDIFGDEMTVSSTHHQAIEKTAPGLSVIQHSDDGVIEAVCGKNIFAVQFHPERMIHGFMRKEYSDVSGLFKMFSDMFLASK